MDPGFCEGWGGGGGGANCNAWRRAPSRTSLCHYIICMLVCLTFVANNKINAEYVAALSYIGWLIAGHLDQALRDQLVCGLRKETIQLTMKMATAHREGTRNGAADHSW